MSYVNTVLGLHALIRFMSFITVGLCDCMCVCVHACVCVLCMCFALAFHLIGMGFLVA